jgi:putative PIN family toxin of toxin-antitoxin system
MRRAVLDSSVLISAFLTPGGTSAQILDAARAGVFVLCLSREILAETAGRLRGKTRLRTRYRYGREQVEAFCDHLAAIAELAADRPELEAVPDDPKDDMIVATAVAAKAAWLVTGDRRHLLPLRRYEGIRILTPREFLDLLDSPSAA